MNIHLLTKKPDTIANKREGGKKVRQGNGKSKKIMINEFSDFRRKGIETFSFY